MFYLTETDKAKEGGLVTCYVDDFHMDSRIIINIPVMILTPATSLHPPLSS